MKTIFVHKDTLLMTEKGLRFGDEIVGGELILGMTPGHGEKGYKICKKSEDEIVKDGFNICTTQSDVIISEDSKIACLTGPTSFKKTFDRYNPYENSLPLVEHLGSIEKLYKSRDITKDLREVRLLGLLANCKAFEDSLTIRCHNENCENLEEKIKNLISLRYPEKDLKTRTLWPDEDIPWAWVKINCERLREDLNLFEHDQNSFLEIRTIEPKALEIFSKGLLSSLAYYPKDKLSLSLLYREKRIRSILYHGLRYQNKIHQCSYSPIASPEIVHVSETDDQANFGNIKTLRRMVDQKFVKLEFDESRFSIYGNLFLIS